MSVDSQVSRAVVAVATCILFVAGLTGVAAAPAGAATTVSSRYLLGQLRTASEHTSGYDRSKFTLWTDADHDGCDTRDEVLIAEATIHPHVGSGCTLSGGQWRSKYDGVTTTNPSSFDIDHLVPLNEAWQSGAWKWSASTRKAYANDLGYNADLIAVTAHENRSKGDQEPQDWIPARAGYACTYVKQWVAAKYRWRLTVNTTERTFVTRKLRSCGWPKVSMPGRPIITAASSGSTSGGRPGGGGGSTVGTVSYAVHPGAFCAEHGEYGVTSAGTRMRCTTTATDARYRWRSA